MSAEMTMEAKQMAEPEASVQAEPEQSEKALKKALAKAEKEAKKAERAAALEQQQQALEAALNKEVQDFEKDSYGILPLINSSTDPTKRRKWTGVTELDESKVGEDIWIRARLQDCRAKGALAFLVLREKWNTVQAVLADNKDAVKFAGSLPSESIVDIFATVVKPKVEIQGATQTVELAVKKLFCMSKAAQELPFQLKDANRREDDEREDAIKVSQDTRLDNRILDLRTLANQAIFRISHETCLLFREILTKKGFTEIHTPKLVGGTSEGGSNVFRLKYFGREACLAQSPQLFKQMAISSDMDRVFEIGPVFRAENSNTHRHLCEFTGLDLEMAFKEHYFEVLEVLEEMFLYIFKGLNERCQKEIAAVFAQYPAEPFMLPKDDKVLRLDFREGVEMLKGLNIGVVPDDISEFDLSTEQEKALGRVIREKYQTDFYYMINYPMGVRPFYTMPKPGDAKFSNSYDFFMRGEEIVSGAQRVHDPNLLREQIVQKGVDPETIKDYIEAFRLGAFPHGGCGIGLERVVMLFLGLNNIRKTSLFPRDPKRIAP